MSQVDASYNSNMVRTLQHGIWMDETNSKILVSRRRGKGKDPPAFLWNISNRLQNEMNPGNFMVEII